MTPLCGLNLVEARLKSGDKSPHSKACFARKPLAMAPHSKAFDNAMSA